MEKKKFGFLVHPRELEDFFIKFPYLRFLPKRLVYYITKYHGPVIASRITGLKNQRGEDVEGYVFGVTMTAHQMMEDPTHARKKIHRAVRYARDKGVGIIGLGALTASFSRGGLDLANIEGIGITTGRAYTVKTIVDYASLALEKINLAPENTYVGIVGAAGSIGSGCARLLAEKGFVHFLLVDLEKKLEKVEERIQHIKTRSPNLVIEKTDRVANIKNCDLVIAATNAPEVVIGPDDLKPGAIVINDAQPSDISPEVLRQRDDVIVIEGGVVRSNTVRGNFNFRLAQRDDTFSCLGEVLILSSHGYFENFAVGELDLSLVSTIEKMAESVDIGISKPQNAHGIIPEEQFEHARVIGEKFRNHVHN